MSTNSNQIDQLMQQTHNKQTKLQKFLRTLDQQTMKQINNYLSQHDNPSNQTNSKTDKIKLYQDLLIIHRFKEHQKSIGNKKKIDQLCQQLKNQIHFSIATIRERIQKKLSNVSKEEILDHIRLQLNFTFNTRRKLMPVKNIQKNSSNSNDIYQQSDIQLDQNNRSEKQSKQSKQSKPISISSSIQQSSQVQQIPQPNQPKRIYKVYQRNDVHSLKKSIRKQQIQSHSNDKSNNKIEEQKDIGELYNQFRAGSEHDSDEELLLIRDGDNYKLSTVKAEIQLNSIMNKIKEQYFEMKNNKQHHNTANISQQYHPQIQPQYNNNPHIHTSQKIPQPNQFSNQQQNQSLIQNHPQPLPSKQQLYPYCSLQDYKLSKQNKQYEYLQWYPDQDQFLMNIITNSNIDKAMSSFQVLKKFKTQQNVIARMRFLRLAIPKFINCDNNNNNTSL